MFGCMDVRPARYEDLDAISDVAEWACAEAIGEMVPAGVVASEMRRRFRKSVLCEHLLSQHLLIGVAAGGQVEMAALVDDYEDHTELATVIAPVHPSQRADGTALVQAVRAMGWNGPLSSSVALGNTAHEQFHEAAGFAPGEVVVDQIAGHEVFRREWWLEPALSAAG
jgi:hypothetical protein